MSILNVLHQELLTDKVTFIRVEPKDLSKTLRDVFSSIANKSWLAQFDQKFLKDSFAHRAEETIKYVEKSLINSTPSKVASDSGELVVSELSRVAVVEQLDYLDIPLAELFKSQRSGNDGFDLYSRNNDDVILFGEAKYVNKKNAYGKAFNKILEFIKENQDTSDIQSIRDFFNEEALFSFEDGHKGYIAAFSSTQIETEQLKKGLQKNKDYKKLLKYDELVCVAVNI